MYNAKQAFVQNPLGRYAIGDRDKLKTGADGSVTIYVQHDSPGEPECLLAEPAGGDKLFTRRDVRPGSPLPVDREPDL